MCCLSFFSIVFVDCVVQNWVVVTTLPAIFTRNDLDLSAGSFYVNSLPQFPATTTDPRIWWVNTLARLLRLRPDLRVRYLSYFSAALANFFTADAKSLYRQRLAAHLAVLAPVWFFDRR